VKILMTVILRSGGLSIPWRLMTSSTFRALFVLLIAGFAGLSALAQDKSPVINSEKHAFRVTSLLTGLENPWAMAFLPDGRMLVTERAGRLRLVGQDFKLDSKPIEGLPDVVAQGQGGLLDVALHPQYAQNGWIYWAYNAPGPGGWGTALARGKLQGHRMTEVRVLFSMQPKTRSSHHFGGRIVIDQVYMYVCINIPI
jgi:glucose/arabinose dehydrogenase